MKIDAKPLQGRVGAAQDGILGPDTFARYFGKLVQRELGAVGTSLGIGATVHLPRYGITDTALRLIHWSAQAAHESVFRYSHEIWGPTEAQRRYEGAQRLGNTQPGDGRLYAGRGIFQLTGRANYRRTGRRIGFDLEGNPELAADWSMAVLIAADYWDDRGMSALADADDIEGVTRLLNGGLNGLDNRRVLVDRAKALLL